MTPTHSLRLWEKLLIGLGAVWFLIFGGIVVLRSALQTERKTDFGVYARAAWAVRAGESLYDITDDRGWHYCYPPPFAILMTPLADPPGWRPREGYLPFAASCAIWYAISLACLGFALHVFAKAVLPNEPRGSRRWWYARTGPAWVCLGGIGMTLSRGQVNLLVVALMAGMFAAAIRRRSISSGLWLGMAIALKVFPALLMWYPLIRRQWKAGIGLAVGLLLALVVLPSLVWGLNGALAANARTLSAVLKPGTVGGGDRSRAKELTDGISTDSQSFQNVIHNWRFRDPATEPETPDRISRIAHWILSGLMLLTTLVRIRRSGASPADELIAFGSLGVVMLLMTPISHMHYYVMALPLVAGLWLKQLASHPDGVWVGWTTYGVLYGWGALTAIPLLPYEPTVWLREMGAGPLLTVGLWAYGLANLERENASVTETVHPQFDDPPHRLAA